MQQDIISLQLNNFPIHLSSSLNYLFKRNNYTDVTLVSDDKVQFQAHKFVLSACSPVMKNLLLCNPHSHPIIFLRGIKQQELQYILQFIYLGNANIHQDSINRFLEILKDLQVKEVTVTFSTDEKGGHE